MTRSNIGYGWRPDLPDHRDYSYTPRLLARFTNPSIVDLRTKCPPVYDQGDLGSCTANAIGAMDQFVQLKQSQPNAFLPSRLFIYYNERAMEGTVGQDAGAYLRDGMKSIARQGVCSEKLWPYSISKFATKPSSACYAEASQHQAIKYMRVEQTLTALRTCLAEGYPFVFGFTVYESFESDHVASTGFMPMPQEDEGVLGGHAVMAVGYSKEKRKFLVRNSWGEGWGQKGYFWMPNAYITNSDLCSDFWTLRTVE